MNCLSVDRACRSFSNTMFTFPSLKAGKCSLSLILIDMIKVIAQAILFPISIFVCLYHINHRGVKAITKPNQSAPPHQHTLPILRALQRGEQSGKVEVKPSDSIPISPYDLSFWEDLTTKTPDLKDLYAPYNSTTHKFTDIYTVSATRIGHILHANKITYQDTSFIVMQAPLQSDDYLNELWNQLFQQEVPPIMVDLTKPIDNTPPYYPTNTTTPLLTISGHEIKLIEHNQISPNFFHYTYTVSRNDTTKTIYRYHYTGWPDFSTPDVFGAFHEMVTTVEKAPNLWIHCRAGVGRTGSLAVAITLKKLIEAGQITPLNLKAKLEEITITYRRQRNTLMIQLEAQYEFVYNYAKYLLEQQQ